MAKIHMVYKDGRGEGFDFGDDPVESIQKEIFEQFGDAVQAYFVEGGRIVYSTERYILDHASEYYQRIRDLLKAVSEAAIGTDFEGVNYWGGDVINDLVRLPRIPLVFGYDSRRCGFVSTVTVLRDAQVYAIDPLCLYPYEKISLEDLRQSIVKTIDVLEDAYKTITDTEGSE